MVMNASIASALAQGLAGYQQGTEDRASLQRRAAEDALATQKAVAASEANLPEQEIEVLKAQNKQLLNSQARAESFESFRAYAADGDVRHLNRALKNPSIRAAHGDTVNISKLDLAADTNLLQQHGITSSMLADPSIDKNALLYKYVKATKPDGSQIIIDIPAVMAGSGFTQHMDQKALEELLTKSKIEKNLRRDQGVPPAIQKQAEYIAKTTGQDVKAVAERLYQKEIAGVTPAKLEMADTAEQSLQTTFKDNFFGTDFTDRKNRVQASKFIRQIEQAGGEELAAADRADLKDISTLIASGETVAEKLTPEATGILDNFTSNVQKYLQDSGVSETEGRAAYNAYRNALLRSFGGTAMSESEVKNFNNAFGTLAQKYPAVISQFKQAIGQTQAKLEMIARMNNPYIAHYYLGTSQDDIDVIMTRLDSTINRKAAFGVPVGEVSDIVETQFGYHIVKVENRKKEEKPFEEVKDQLRSRTEQINRNKVYFDYMDELRENAEYQIVDF